MRWRKPITCALRVAVPLLHDEAMTVAEAEAEAEAVGFVCGVAVRLWRWLWLWHLTQREHTAGGCSRWSRCPRGCFHCTSTSSPPCHPPTPPGFVLALTPQWVWPLAV